MPVRASVGDKQHIRLHASSSGKHLSEPDPDRTSFTYWHNNTDGFDGWFAHVGPIHDFVRMHHKGPDAAMSSSDRAHTAREEYRPYPWFAVTRVASVCGKTPFYDGFKPRDGIRRSGDHVDLGDVRRVIGPSGLQKSG